jgi:hypothetical protein
LKLRLQIGVVFRHPAAFLIVFRVIAQIIGATSSQRSHCATRTDKF